MYVEFWGWFSVPCDHQYGFPQEDNRGGAPPTHLMCALTSPLAEPVGTDAAREASFVCLPRPGVVVIYNQFEITRFRFADASTMGEGAVDASLDAPRSLGNDRSDIHVSLVECADVSRSLFEARFVEF